MQNTICIIGVYFGELPKYFNLWKMSAEYNHGVDFLIVTDQSLKDLPANVRTLQMSLGDMESLAACELNLTDVSIKRPYKCCDFKPVYGIIFREYVKEYEYWGHCDFDMIFGDISGFLEKYNYRSYDKFLTLGHLTFYRNTDENMKRYICSGSYVDYRTVFTTDKNFMFDEITGITQIYERNGFSQFKKRIFCDISSIYSRYRDVDEYVFDEKPVNHPYQVYCWKNGHTYRQWFNKSGGHEEEYIYIHFKRRPNFEVDFNPGDNEGFFITRDGFVPFKGNPNIRDAIQLNKYNPIKELYEKVRHIMKPYIEAIKVRIWRGE